MHHSQLLAFLSLSLQIQYLFHVFEVWIVTVDGFGPDDFKFVIGIHINCLQQGSTIPKMKIFAGTYQGSIFFLEGTPSQLKIKTTRAVSENSIRSIALIGDELLVGGYDQQFRALSSSTGTETKESKESKGMINCIRNVNQNLMVMGLENGMIRFWDKKSWASRRDVKQHKKAITDIKIDRKGLMMVSIAGRDMTFWNTATLKSLYHFRYEFDIEQVLLQDNFEYLFLLGDKNLRQISTQDNKQLFKIELKDRIQCGMTFLNYVLVATEKGEIRIWRHGEYQHCIHFQAHSNRIKNMKEIQLQGADFLVTADSSGEIRVWDIFQFLKGVDAISQDYDLSGLKPLSSVQTFQRILCLEVSARESEMKVQKKEEVDEKQVKVEEDKQKKKKKKLINKSDKKQKKSKKVQ